MVSDLAGAHFTSIASYGHTCRQESQRVHLSRVNHVARVGRHGDGVHGAVLGAEGAAGAVVAHAILDERLALAGRTAALQVRFIFVAEIAQRGQHRVGRGLAKAAQAALG